MRRIQAGQNHLECGGRSMTDSSSRGRIPELDGLRGLAILLVLVFHYISQEGLTPSHSLASYLQRLVVMGWTGVDLFFVLSGFLIGGILMDVRASPTYYQTFYIRRLFRIIPIYYGWVFLYIALLRFAGPIVRVHSNSGVMPTAGLPIYLHFLFLQNLGLITLSGLAGAWFGHTWSLAVEEQFYLISPFLVRTVPVRRLPAFLSAVVVVAPVLRVVLLSIVHVEPSLVGALMPCRADSLATGMLAAALWRDRTAREWLSARGQILYSALGVLLAGSVALWVWSPQSSTFGMQSVGYTWIALLYVVILLLALTRPEGPIASMMRTGWIRQVGGVSYCIYMIHLAVNVVCHAVFLHAPPRISNVRAAAVTIFAALLTYGLAKLSWIFFENPLLRYGHASRY
jgi:peptidoglycan/LPS O-acetylase OafA/YrhL